MCSSSMPPAARRIIWAVQARYTGHIEQAVDDLTTALAETKEAHGAWESTHGPDGDWTRWYAKYLLGLDPTPEGHDHAADPTTPHHLAGHRVAS